MKKRLVSLLLVAVMVLGLVACGGSEETTEEAATEEAAGEVKDTFTYSMFSDLGTTLNYFTADSREAMTFVKLVDTPLFSMLPDGSLNFYMAESFETEDGVTYTCKLNPNAKWSDGEVLDADDVIFTFEQYAATMDVEGGVFQTAKYNKVDDTTVEFVLAEPSATFPEDVSAVYLLPQHVFEGKDSFDYDLTSDTVVGCGAYMFDSYENGAYIKAVTNPNYALEAAKIPNVVFRVIEDDNVAIAALQNGEIDAWVGLATLLDGLEDFTITPYSEGRVAYVRLNRVSDNMQDADYRKGVLKALNKEEILTAAYGSLDYASPSYSFLPKTNSNYTEDLEKFEQDLEASKELVAGGATALKLCYVDEPAQSAQAQVIQAQLKEVGIEVELCGLEQGAYMETAYDCEDKTYDMYLGGYIMTIDPAGYAGMFTTGNMINYANKEIDDLFAASKVETDPEKRAEMFVELQQLVAEEALFYPFGTNLRIFVTNPALKGMEEDAKFVPIYTFDDYAKLYFE